MIQHNVSPEVAEIPEKLVVYGGRGLKDVPRGTVKSLRVFSYTYDYPDMGGPQGVVGLEGPWDVRRILGTVPVEKDGSAMFKVPASTPIAPVRPGASLLSGTRTYQPTGLM